MWLGEVAPQAARIDIAQHRRRFTHRHRARPNGSMDNPKRASSPARSPSRAASARRRSTISGISRTLARDAVFLDCRLHALHSECARAPHADRR